MQEHVRYTESNSCSDEGEWHEECRYLLGECHRIDPRQVDLAGTSLTPCVPLWHSGIEWWNHVRSNMFLGYWVWYIFLWYKVIKKTEIFQIYSTDDLVWIKQKFYSPVSCRSVVSKRMQTRPLSSTGTLSLKTRQKYEHGSIPGFHILLN